MSKGGMPLHDFSDFTYTFMVILALFFGGCF